MVIIACLQKLIAKAQAKHTGKLQSLRSERANKVEETINGIKIIKFNAWEKERIKKLDSMRKKEHKGIFKMFMFYGITEIMNALNTPLIALFCFWIYSAIYRELTIPEIYSMLALVSGLDTPMSFLVYSFLNRGKAMVFCEKFAKLLAVTKQGTQEDDNQLKKGEILIQSGDFHWNNEQVEKVYKLDKDRKNKKSQKQNSVRDISNGQESARPINPQDDLVLKNINLNIKPGEFIGVIGKVGSGKSSLLKAMSNEILKSKGTVKKNGSIALIPQEAFLMNDTVKNNILFGIPYNEERYQRALRLSELKADLKILRAGDATQIGERGINLSGGQRQRISIARALYSENDIYLIDDALSALDAHVGHNVMENGFKRALSGKTRIMVTHQLKLLSEFDKILLIHLGKVSCEGTFVEIKDLPEFNEFYQEALKQEENKETPKELNGNSRSQQQDQMGKFNKNPGSRIILSPIDSDQLKGEIKENQVKGERQHHSDQGNQNSLKLSSKRAEEGDKERNEATLHEKHDQKTEKERLLEGRIIAQENSSKGGVSFGTYCYYAKRLGYFRLILVCITFTICIAWMFALDYFISVWMTNRLELQNKGLYPFIYLGMILIFVIILGIRMIIFGATFSKGGYVMLKEAIHNILRRKMSYFDTTPIGQIITRTSDDVYTVDLLLPARILYCSTPIFMLFGTCIFIAIISPLQIIIIVPIIFLMGRALKKFAKISIQFQRMLLLASAPLISTLSELMKGAESLRVYNKLSYLKRTAKRRCDVNTAAILHEGLFYQWIIGIY